MTEIITAAAPQVTLRRLYPGRRLEVWRIFKNRIDLSYLIDMFNVF
jgi:hypothetical protein